jgi:hypothetical protein
MILALGYGIYYYFTHRDENLTKKYLNGTKYEFLNRFYEKDDGEKFIYVVKGIIYNAKQNDLEVVFDMNAWDLKTRESLYFSNISLGNVKMEDIDIEDVMYDFKPVSIQFEFEKKKLVSFNMTPLSIESIQYTTVLKNVVEFLNRKDSGSSFPSSIQNENGNAKLYEVLPEVDAQYPLFVSKLQLENEEMKSLEVLDVIKYIDSLKKEVEEKHGGSVYVGSLGCTLTKNLTAGNYLDVEQINILKNLYCNKEKFEKVVTANNSNGYKWENLQGFVIDKEIDFVSPSPVLFATLYRLPDVYSYSSVQKRPLSDKEITVVENYVADNVLANIRDKDSGKMPFDLVSELLFTVSQVEGFKEIPKYNSVYKDLVNLVKNQDREVLLKSLENDTAIELKALVGLSSSDNIEVKNLLNAEILKLYYLNVYSEELNGEEYNSLWSKTKLGKKYLLVEDNIRYLTLLQKVYEKK